jgi:hypothetical protein
MRPVWRPEETFSISTGYYRNWACAQRSEQRFLRALRHQSRQLPAPVVLTLQTYLEDRDIPFPGDVAHLLEVYRQALPGHKDWRQWHAYVAAVLPILAPVLQARLHRKVRSAALLAYQARDRALDRVCRRIVGLHLPRRQRRRQKACLVALGGARTCSTGFGHAPAPQQRLCRRLQTFGAQVVVIDERHTSQLCWHCHGRLEKVFSRTGGRRRAGPRPRARAAKAVVPALDPLRCSRGRCSPAGPRLRRGRRSFRRYVAVDVDLEDDGDDPLEEEMVVEAPPESVKGAPEPAEEGPPEAPVPMARRRDLWGVRRCRACTFSSGHGPLHVHRDVNAARNILFLYLAAAAGEPRPPAFAA